ncbi:craniofacial development protein 2-like [Octopus bimaculoides]|uniref:craniofacial development protein 2-like n=1 Tax=Octopus bimaculoides TaxID=37653 RepID=UPI0022E96E4B|nr:craniofacial development protein 2-like [Octopus bimaculoides]
MNSAKCELSFQVHDTAVPRPRVSRAHTSHTLRVGTLNVGTLKGRSGEIVEMLERRCVDLCCLQEVRWRGGSTRFLTGKEHRYKIFWAGNTYRVGGVSILLAEKWVDKVIEVVSVCDRILKIILVPQHGLATIISAYASQLGLPDGLKDRFYDTLLQTTSLTNDRDILFVAGDFNGHVGQHSGGFYGVHGGYGFGSHNEEGTRLLEFCDANDLMVCKSNFRKPANHLFTYRSGRHTSQIDYILTRKRERWLLINAKSFPGEECTPQHRLVVSDFRIRAKWLRRR